jgi:sugar transferase (PEP-CTERM system associated)
MIASETALIVGAIGWAASMSAFTPDTLVKALPVALLCQVCLYYAELYDFRVLSDRRELVVRLLQSIGAASIVLAFIYLVFPDLVIGRGVFLRASLLMVSLAVGWRLAFEWVSARVGHREQLLLVGTGAATIALAQEMIARKDLGVDIVGFVGTGSDADDNPAEIRSIAPVLGDVSDIPELVRSYDVDRVVVSLAEARGRLPMDQLLHTKLTSGVRFDLLASVYEELTGKIAVENLRPSWFIFSDGFRKRRVFGFVKRSIDIAAGLLGLALTGPIMGIIALAVRSTSPGPALYSQRRVGLHGRVFTLYKFRSMNTGAEARTGAVWATSGDRRVTPVGRILRKFRLDELPQFWNVLIGDMSFVGPRPERPEFVEQLTKDIAFYPQRHVVRPGLTGWAQVKYRYGSSVADSMEKLQWDLFYVKNMCATLDLFIIFKTLQTVILQRGT